MGKQTRLEWERQETIFVLRVNWSLKANLNLNPNPDLNHSQFQFSISISIIFLFIYQSNWNLCGRIKERSVSFGADSFQLSSSVRVASVG